MATSSRHLLVIWLVAGAEGCGEARAPGPAEYALPDSFAYRIDFVSDAQNQGRSVMRYAESKLLRLRQRDELYIGRDDSVLKTSQVPGRAVSPVPLSHGDTMAFYVRLGRNGRVREVQPGCDPAVPACAAVMPSTMQLTLQRVFPRLPVWAAPRGTGWVDTMQWNDAPRPRASRGTVVTSYRPVRDTVIAGREYWVLPWTAVRRAYRPRGEGAAESLAAETPVEESGVVFVDQLERLPVFATWLGAVAIPAELHPLGATVSAFRGRAYLVGSAFDIAFAAERPSQP
jgi:hypothetical protein